MHRLNGEACDTASLTDRGFQYGDGVFTTLKLHRGRPVFWPRHYARLMSDAQRLGLQCPQEKDCLDDIRSLAQECGDGVVKCVVTRGIGGRGYRPDSRSSPTRVMYWSPFPNYPASLYDLGVSVRVCRLRLGRQPALAGVKHLNRLENVLARMEWDDPALFEGLLLDEAGIVIEGTISNIFWRNGPQWKTPVLDQCGVAGVIRTWVIDHLAASAYPIQVVRQTMDRLVQADEVFICNSLLGIVPVKHLADREWRDFSETDRLRRCLQEDEYAL